MSTPDEIADLIDAAHDELLARGWCQHQDIDEAGRVCTGGAIALAAGVPQILLNHRVGWPQESYDSYTAAYLALLGGGSVIEWNDTPGRTEDEVFDAFRQTSKRLREEAGK